MIKEITSYAQLQEEMKRIVAGIGHIGQQLILIEKAGYTPEEYHRQREMMYAYLIQERAKLDYYRTMSENYMTVLHNYDILRMIGQGNEIGLSQVDKKQIEEEIIILSQVLPEGLKQEIMGTRTEEEEKEEVKEEITSIEELDKRIRDEQDKLAGLHQELAQVESAVLDEAARQERKEELQRAFGEIGENLARYISMRNNYTTIKQNRERIKELESMTPSNEVEKLEIERSISELESENKRKSENLNPALLESMKEKEAKEVKEENQEEEIKEEDKEITSIEELEEAIKYEQDRLITLHIYQTSFKIKPLDEKEKEELHREFGEIGEKLARYFTMRGSYSSIKRNRVRIKELRSMTPSNEAEKSEIERSIRKLEFENEMCSTDLNPALLESMEEKVVQEDNQVEKPEEVKDIEIDNNENKLNTEVPVDVQVEQTDEEVSTEDKPAEVSEEDKVNTEVPVDVQVEQTDEDVSTEDKPAEVSEDNKLNTEVPVDVQVEQTDEVPVEEQNLQLPAVVTPPIFGNQTVTTEEKPAEVSEDNKLNTEVPVDVQVEQTGEDVSTEEKPAEVSEDNKLNTEVPVDVQVEQTDEVPVEEQNLQLPAVVTPPIFGNQTRPAEEDKEIDNNENKVNTEVPVDVQVEQTDEDVSTEEKPAEVSEDNKLNTEVPVDVIVERTSEEVSTEDKPAEVSEDNKLNTEVPVDVQVEQTDEDVSTEEKPAEVSEENKEEDNQEYLDIELAEKRKDLVEAEARLENSIKALQNIYNFMREYREDNFFSTVEELDKADEDYLNIMSIYNNRYVDNRIEVERLKRKVAILESIQQERAKAKDTAKVLVKDDNSIDNVARSEEVQNEVPVEEQSLQLPAVVTPPIFGNQTRPAEEEKDIEIEKNVDKANTEEPIEVQVEHVEEARAEGPEDNRNVLGDGPSPLFFTEDESDNHLSEEDVENNEDERPENEEEVVEDEDDMPLFEEEDEDDMPLFRYREESQPKRSLQSIIASVLVDPETGDPINMTVKQRKRFEKSNISITGALKNGLTYGNYLYNLTSIAPTIIGVIPNALMKLSGKIMLTRKAKHNIKVVKENLDALSDADLEVLYREYKGDTIVNLRGAAAVNGFIKEAVEKYQERKYIAPKRAEMKVLYETILSDYEQIENNKVLIHQITSGTMSEPDANTLIEKLGVADLNQAVALLEHRNNRLMSGKVYLIEDVRELGKMLQPELSSGKHGFAEDIRATDSKMNLQGRRFAKDISTGAAQEMMAYMGQLQEKEADAIERDDDETALKAFIKLETTQARESKIEGSLLGRREAGLYHYNPIPEELDYRQDPFVRNVLTTVTTAAMIKGVIDQIHNRMMGADLRRINEDRANQQKVIDDVNQRNSEANAHNANQEYAVQQGSAQLTGSSESMRRGMEAQINQDIAATRATHEYMDHDATGWSFNDAYHAADQAHHTAVQNAAQDAQNQLSLIQQDLAAGRISDVEAMRQIALVNSDTHSMFQQAVREALPVFKQYAQEHPNIEYGEYIASLERLGADPTAIDALNQQAINAIEVGNTLQGVNILPYEELGIILEEVPTGIKNQLYLLGAAALMTGHAATQAQQFSKESDNEEILGALEAVVENDESRKERHERIDRAVQAARTNENVEDEEVQISNDEEDLSRAEEDNQLTNVDEEHVYTDEELQEINDNLDRFADSTIAEQPDTRARLR